MVKGKGKGKGGGRRSGQAATPPQPEVLDALPTPAEEAASLADFRRMSSEQALRQRSTTHEYELASLSGAQLLRTPDADDDDDKPRESKANGDAATAAAAAPPKPAGTGWRASVVSWWHKLVGSLGIAVGYVVADNRKRKRTLTIGVTTVFLIVCFLSLIQNVLVRSPVIFVKLAEDQVGQYDVLMVPQPTNTSLTFFLNYTHINASLASVKDLYGAAPRWMLVGEVANIEDPERNSSAVLLIIDSDLEKSIGLGRQWNHRALGEDEVHLSASTVRRLGLQPNAGDRLRLVFNASSFLAGLFDLDSLTDLIGLGLPNLPPVNITLPPGGLNFSAVEITVPGTNFTVNLGDLLGGLNQTAVNVTLEAIQEAINQQLNVTGLDNAFQLFLYSTISNSDFLVFERDYTLVDAIPWPDGKFPAVLGSVAILEMDYFEEAVKAQLLGSVNTTVNRQIAELLNITSLLDQVVTAIDGFSIRENALMVIGTLTDRLDIYTLSETDRDARLLTISDDIVVPMGLDWGAEITFPLVEGITATSFIRLFLDEIFFAVNGVLVILAVLLIYSLLLSDVEERTFEYGMLRTLGMGQVVLVPLLLLQSLLFSVPGILAGFLVCFIIYAPVDLFLSLFAVIPVQVSLNWSAILLGVLLGIFMPILGVILPIRRALSQTLRDSLDVYHNTVYDSIIRVQRLENIGVSVTTSIVSIILVVVGFVVYYLVPLSFIFNNITFFFRILTLILLGMVIGQVLITQSFELYLEHGLVWLLIWGRDRILAHIVIKNLHAHRPRNQKTAIMFTLCVGFVIFAGTMFVLQAESIPENLAWLAGADVSASASGIDDPLPEADIRAFLDTLLVGNPSAANLSDGQFAVVEGYTFMSYALEDWPQGVEENYLDVTKNNLLIVSEVRAGVTVDTLPSGSPNVVQALYQPVEMSDTYVAPVVLVPGDMDRMAKRYEGLENDTYNLYTQLFPSVMPEAFRDGLYVDTNTRMVVKVNYNRDDNSNGARTWLMQPVAMVRKMPAILSINRLQVNGAPLLVAMDQLASFVTETLADAGVIVNYTAATVPKKTVLVRIADDATWYQVEAVVNGLGSLLTGVADLQVVNLRDQISQTKLATDMIILFFDIVAVIGMVFCFFMLWLSFTANIRENSWEYGVLRALGLTASTVLRLYIYEAIVIVLSCLILGSALGVLTASIVTLQTNLFTESPFVFEFPVALFIIVVVLSGVVAIAGSYFAAGKYKRLEVAIALRG